jgi:uncharacterized protein (DUF2141 family)
VTGSIEDLQHESCSGLEDGYLRISAGGGTAPYVFTLTQGTTTLTSASGEFFNLAPGDYTLSISDDLGCDWTRSSVIEIKDGNSLSLTIKNKGALTCHGANTAFFIVEAEGLPSGNYEFRRDPSSAWVGAGQSTYTFTDLADGTYVVAVRDRDNPGCQDSETVVIILKPLIMFYTN